VAFGSPLLRVQSCPSSMAAVIRPPEEEVELLDEWEYATANIESFGCGQEDEADRQGIQPLP